jgi:Family of unknown function (DUF6130)
MKTMRIPLVAMAFALCTSGAFAQTAREIRGPAGVVPLASEEPPPKIIIDPPVADWLARGMVVIQYRAENLRIVQVFGPAALDVSPRIGHIHVTVDDAPWRWADASGDPHHQPPACGAAQDPDRARQREPPDPRPGGRQLRDPVSDCPQQPSLRPPSPVPHLQAQRRNPARWSRHTRDWSPIGPVTLNPERDQSVRPAAQSSQDKAALIA